jgi:hypothetical protein
VLLLLLLVLVLALALPTCCEYFSCCCHSLSATAVKALLRAYAS